MEIQKSDPFSILLSEAIGQHYNAVRTLSERTESYGKKISVRMINRYRSGECIPTLENASILAELLGMNLDYDELRSSLLEGERQRPVIKKDKNESNRKSSVSIDYGNIQIDGLSSEEVEFLIGERVNDMFGDENNAFSKYIEHLIQEDLKR